MRPQVVVVPSPVIIQGLGLCHGGEQLGIQELIPEPSVERLGKAVLPRCSWSDLVRGGAAVFAPALEGVSDEFGPVVATEERCGLVEAGELFQHRHDVFGLAASAHPDGLAATAVLVDHVEEPEPPAIGRGDELEVHRPDLVPVLSLVMSHRAVSRA